MDLDARLAALAADALDPEEARALRARVAGDPALQQRLQRIERLDEVLAEWNVPAMDDAARDRLDDAVDRALADLPDGPLVARDATVVPIGTAGSGRRSKGVGGAVTAPAGGPRTAAGDVGAQRSGWLTGLVAAAVAVTAIGGLGIVLGGGSDGDGLFETTALDADDQGADEAADDSVAAELAPDEMVDGATDEMVDDMAEDSADAAGDSAAASGEVPPVAVLVGLDLGSEDELSELAGEVAQDLSRYAATSADDALRSLTAAARPCLDAAFEQVPGSRVALVGEGTYAGTPAVFVVLATGDDDGTVLALAADGCRVLAEAPIG